MSTASAGGVDAGGAMSSAATTGGEGGFGGVPVIGGFGGESGDAPCGNGVADDGEECDDGNVNDADGCSSVCVVECDPFEPLATNEIVWKDPVTHHCYRWTGSLGGGGFNFAGFQMAFDDCLEWNADIAALSTLAEHEAVIASGVVPKYTLDVVLGGRDLEGNGVWSWSNGEPWIYTAGLPPWPPWEPGFGTFLQIYSDGAFSTDGDNSASGWLCERTPLFGRP